MAVIAATSWGAVVNIIGNAGSVRSTIPIMRQTVTKEELALKHLVTALAATETFYCGGTAQYARAVKHTLMYTTDSGARVLRIPRASDGDLEMLHNDCSTMKVAQGPEQTTTEPRQPGSLARELPEENFGFNFDPLGDGMGLLAAISAFCKVGVVARMHRLYSFVFTDGGRVKVNKGGAKHGDHLGTLLIGLHTPPGAGELLLHRDGTDVDINWNGTHHHSTEDRLVLPWAFIYSDVDCEIQLDKSGHQLILAYEIYTSGTVQYYQNATAQAMDVLPEGGILAFGLTYAYLGSDNYIYTGEPAAAATVSDSDRILSMLKGCDAIMYHALKESGLKVQLKAVYLESCDNFYDYGDGADDDFSCFGKESTDILLTADSFKGFGEHNRANFLGDRGTSTIGLLESEIGAKVASDMIWVKWPEVFHEANSFLNYGESVDHNLASVAFVVDIPRVVEGHRQEY
ncbi:hypothetical protein FRB94_012998 [Tulasnella sp. JGI-2019a]|nr:hypothetical protein FRB94_012998 [Tulasnella sp. JGI-2019a]